MSLPIHKSPPGPYFRVVTDRDAFTPVGTRLFCMGNEIHELVSVEHSTHYSGDDTLVTTTITIKMIGPQVETEFLDLTPDT
jgi:hypothetical protein